MEQRVKKKYVEKIPPDITHKPTSQKRQERIYNQEKNYNPSNTYQTTSKPRFIDRNEKQFNNQQKPKYVAKQNPNRYQTRQQNQQKQQIKDQRTRQYPKPQKKQYYQKPKLTEKQSSHYEEENCLICSQHITKRDYIWTCACCFISMHLKCIKAWILNVNRDKKKNDIIFTWSCPQCKFQFNDAMPKYYCYCGKFKDPQYERDIEPHSCGQICGRKRGPYCPHTCPQVCHKGKCKPCQHEGTLVSCECGKSSRLVKCSQQRQIFQCGKKCQKILDCFKHKCQRNCHHGECFPCKKKHLVSCYCKKNEDVVDCIQTSYSCKEICGQKLNCEFHTCQDLCHFGPCKSCQKTPQLQKTCPCGAYSIEMLTGDQNFRKKCEDPIPTCGMPCKKILSCGHKCSKSCHEGTCSQCKIIVNQSCACGLTSRKIQCYKAHSQKQILKCDNVCKKKRSCGMHNCNTECCPHRNSSKPDDHPCELTCPKMLNCGKHTCGENCHLGLCKKCPVIYSQPQPCPCGKTSLRPPIVCGTIVPQCDNICQKIMDCGHKCLKICHYGKCQCYEEIFVKCRCGKENIKTICGRETLCLNKCQNILPCGHKCGIQCHNETCQQAHKHQPCRKICEKIRPDCNHSCGQYCHPSKRCIQFPCEAQIFIKCECGHRQTSILCGMSKDKKHKKEIKCNSKCDNLKRFDVLYKGKEIYYPANMVHFGIKHLQYVQNVQQKLAKFILQSQEPVIELQYKFNQSQSKLILLNLFQNHYHLNAHFYRHKKFSSFTLLQSENTMIPKPTLSEYVEKITKGQIKRANLPFEYTITFESETKDKCEIILRSLRPFLHKYYIQRKEKSVLVHFWAKEDGKRVLNCFETENPSVQFRGEQHFNEDDIEIIADTDIIETELIEEEAEENIQIKNQECLTKQSQPKSDSKTQQPIIHPTIQTNIQQQSIIELKQSEQPAKKIIKIIPPPPTQQPQKKKVTTIPKIIIKKSNLLFQPKEYPDSKENVQDIYLIDDDEMYQQKVDWPKIVTQLSQKNMGPEATEWRIRSFLMINAFSTVPESVFRMMFQKLLKMYKKDKDRAKRILELQKLDIKIVKQQMAKDGIYLSDHQPEILGYLILFNYFLTDKIDFQLQEYQLNTAEVTQAQQVLHAVQFNNFEEFYTIFNSSQYVLSCALIPFVHALRENLVDILEKKEKIAAKNLYKYLLFDSEEELIRYLKECGIQVGVRFSKSLKEDVYFMKQGKALGERIKKNEFIDKLMKSKRDKKYFLVEADQVIEDQFMTRSFFAFGDFKQSLSNKYMIQLIKSLKSSK